MLSVSVVVPCYNGERYLPEAMESIVAQTRSPAEVIVVDDGSTDRSAEVAESFGATVVRQENRGEGAARNAGIRAATGDAIAMLDADDRWRPHHLAVVAGLLERNPEAAGAFGAVERFGMRNGIVRGYVPTDSAGHVLAEAFRDWLHTTIASVVRRSVLLEVGGFDEHERSSVDFDLWLRMARAHRFVSTDEVTSDWRWHSAQQSASRDVQVAAVYRYRRRFLDALVQDGDTALAASLETEFARIWSRDVLTAVRAGDAELVRVLRAASRLPVGLRPWERAAWTAVSHAPPPMVTRAYEARRAMKDWRTAQEDRHAQHR